MPKPIACASSRIIDVAARRPPSHVLLIATYRCNLRCPYCLVFDPVRYWQADASIALPPAKVGEEMSTAQIVDRVIPQCEALGVQALALTGGEVMLRRDIDAIFRRLGESSMAWCIDSNLSRCTPVLAAEIVAARCDTVFVSIDGPEEVHNKLRASRFAFHQAIRGLRNVLDARAAAEGADLRIVMNCVLQEGNEAHVAEVVQLADEWGVDGVAFQLLSGLSYDVRFDSREAALGLRHARQLAAELEIEMSVFPISEPTPAQLDRWFTSSPAGTFFKGCDYVESSLRIDPAGNVIPCVENVVGNILDQDLEAIWKGPAYQLFRDSIHAKPLQACHRCCNMTA